MTFEKDLVSIVVPTYNDEAYLREALDDIVAQTYEKIEVIIVNDGSTDNTEEVLKEYCKKHDNFTYYNKENGGTGSALNFGFAKATGEFGTWFSSDDRKEPQMIERMAEFLKKNRDVEYVTAAFRSNYLNTILRSYVPSQNGHGFQHHRFGAPHDNNLSGKSFIVDDWIDINRQQCYQGVNFMWTKRLKDECGDFICMPGEDYYMAAEMGLRTRVGYIDECLGTHQNPPDSLSVQNRACVHEANLKTWSLIDEKYKKWHLKKVPKIAHFYWGSDKMSFLRYMTIKSFKKHNPGWSACLYVPKKLSSGATWSDKDHRCDLSDYEGEKDYLEEVKKMAVKIVEVDFEKIFGDKQISEVHRSDYIRWYLLHHRGGVWCDMDILFLRPLEDMKINILENKNLDVSINMSEQHGSRIGLLVSSKNKNPFFAELESISKRKLQNNDSEDMMYQTLGAYATNRVLSRFYDPETKKMKITYNTNEFVPVDLESDNLHCNDFYFYDHHELHKIYDENNYEEALKNCIGIHWFGGSPKSQEQNNKISANNYKDIDSTICVAIKNILEER